jgi:prepilin-type N-terminal cleavage/methylation domain-containing protein
MHTILDRLSGMRKGVFDGAGGAGSGNRGSRRRRKGFTLVEVIVVLVILAILATIAIPALTGYIDKAEDKKYIAQARNAIVAIRTVINNEYADGTLTIGGADAEAFIVNGRADWYSNSLFKWKNFYLNYLSMFNTVDADHPSGVKDLYGKKAAELIGVAFPGVDSTNRALPGYWEIRLLAPKGSSYTILDAPAFAYLYFPEGVNNVDAIQNSNVPVIAVTYAICGINPSVSTYSQLFQQSGGTTSIAVGDPYYDSGAGYQVFHLVGK